MEIRHWEQKFAKSADPASLAKHSPLLCEGFDRHQISRFKVQNRNRHAIADTASHRSIVPDETAFEFDGNCSGFRRTRSLVTSTLGNSLPADAPIPQGYIT